MIRIEVTESQKLPHDLKLIYPFFPSIMVGILSCEIRIQVFKSQPLFE